jgi:hypothetical protein
MPCPSHRRRPQPFTQMTMHRPILLDVQTRYPEVRTTHNFSFKSRVSQPSTVHQHHPSSLCMQPCISLKPHRWLSTNQAHTSTNLPKAPNNPSNFPCIMQCTQKSFLPHSLYSPNPTLPPAPSAHSHCSQPARAFLTGYLSPGHPRFQAPPNQPNQPAAHCHESSMTQRPGHAAH